MAIANTAAIFGSPQPLEKSMATVKQLKKQLDGLGVEYSSKATKAQLEVLIANAERKPPPADREPRPRMETKRADIKITCMVETLDGEVHEQEIFIVNPMGCIPGAYVNKPDTVYDVLRAGLVAKLGKNHVR